VDCTVGVSKSRGRQRSNCRPETTRIHDVCLSIADIRITGGYTIQAYTTVHMKTLKCVRSGSARMVVWPGLGGQPRMRIRSQAFQRTDRGNPGQKGTPPNTALPHVKHALARRADCQSAAKLKNREWRSQRRVLVFGKFVKRRRQQDVERLCASSEIKSSACWKRRQKGLHQKIEHTHTVQCDMQHGIGKM